MFGGSDRTDALPGIREKIIETGLLDTWRAQGVKINPDFVEIELISGEARFIADRFFDLSSGRSGGGFGITPLTWQDYHAYCKVRRVKFSNWELDLLRVLDGEFCRNAQPPKK